jgi:uncharacterized protein YijF (DUF1287 family)
MHGAGDDFDAPLPGDSQSWRVWAKRPHLGVVVHGPDGVRAVHKIGLETQEEP